jgi:sugar transferase (PEP-CTERM/EpsH1 system associated)
MADRRIHVAHVVHNLERGGLQNGIANLLSRLPSERWRHTVFALAGLGPAAARLPPEIAVRALERRPGRDWRVVWRLARELRADPPAIVRTYNWATWLEGFAAARLARVPALVHSEHQQPFGETPAERRRRDRVRRFLARRTDAVIALSREIARRLEGEVGVDPGRITTIVNGVDCAAIAAAAAGADRTAKLAALGLGPETLVVGAVGRIVVEKDFGTLVAALPAIAAGDPRAHVILAGDGPLKEGLVRRAETLGVSDRLHLLGERADVPEILGIVDIFVLPSVSEGISNTILEAMAAGCAIVTTPVGGTPEIVERGRTALFVEPRRPEALARAVLELARDPLRRAALGAEARRVAREERSLEGMARRYDALYTEVLWRKRLLAGERDVAPPSAPAPAASSQVMAAREESRR